MKYLTLLFVFFTFSSFAQSSSVTKIVDQIDYQNDTLLAVFNWVTDNIKYDVKKAKDMKNGVSFFKKGKFKTIEDYKKAQLERVIKKKKGVCEDYTLLFSAIVTELGYKSNTIGGITKNRKGKISNVGHSWIAVQENGTWKLYDPTWGAGYVNEKKRFIKKYTVEWYDVEPEVMKERHFPFGPMWQVSNSPLTFEKFKKNKPSLESGGQYDFEAQIEDFLQKDKLERCTDELRRLEQLDTNFKLIKKRIDYLRNVVNKSEVTDIREVCKASSATFSKYMREGKSKRFLGEKWTQEYSQKTLLGLEETINQSIAALKKIKVKKAKNKKGISNTISMSKQLLTHVKKELKFLKKFGKQLYGR